MPEHSPHDVCEVCELATELAEERSYTQALRSALERIAAEDYRGNEPASIRIAREALDRG